MSLPKTVNNIQIIMARTEIAFVIMGNAGTVPVLFVFFQKRARKSPCIMFLIAFLVRNLVLINYTILLSTLALGFNMDLSINSTTSCQFKFYIALVFGTMPTFFLIMASFDRVLISSANINIRLRSTRRCATVVIIIIIIFWCIFHIPVFFYTNVFQVFVNRLVCAPTSSYYTTFITYYSLFVVSILPSVLFVILAIKTIFNMSRIRRRAAQRSTATRIRRNERHLIILLLLQVSLYLITHFPLLCYSIYAEMTKSIAKDANQSAVESLVRFFTGYMNFVHVAFTPWINFLSRSFRIESKEMFRRIWAR